MEDTNDDKIVKGKMIDDGGNEFDVFLMKNMSLFIGYNIVFILPPYNDRRALNNGFNENNRCKYKDQEQQQQLYSFFQGTERFVFYYTEKSKIQYSINDENDKIELHLPSNNITIQNPSHTSTKTITQELTITSETTPQDVYSQLGIDKLVQQPFKEQNEEKRKKNNKEEKSGTLDTIDIKRDKNDTFQEVLIEKRINQGNKNKFKINPEINNINNLNPKNEKNNNLNNNKTQTSKVKKNSQSGGFYDIFNWCNCCNFEEEKKEYELNNNTMNK